MPQKMFGYGKSIRAMRFHNLIARMAMDFSFSFTDCGSTLYGTWRKYAFIHLFIDVIQTWIKYDKLCIAIGLFFTHISNNGFNLHLIYINPCQYRTVACLNQHYMAKSALGTHTCWLAWYYSCTSTYLVSISNRTRQIIALFNNCHLKYLY